jgi:hypothetical protein
VERMLELIGPFKYLNRKFSLSILGLFLFFFSADGRSLDVIPLMPPRQDSIAGNQFQINSSRRTKELPETSYSLNFEFGMLMNQESLHSDILGMQILAGGRLGVIFPMGIIPFVIKPSLGYFRRQQLDGFTSNVQQVIEGGLVLEYPFLKERQFEWSLGLANKLDDCITQNSLAAQSYSTQSLRYRLGPSTGLKFRVSKGIQLTADFETTFYLGRFNQLLGGLTSGVAFDL